MDQQHLSAPESAQINVREPLYGTAADRVRDQLRTPSDLDLDVAISVAREMLAEYGDSNRPGFSYAEACGALRATVRGLLRALDAEPVDEAEAVRRSVDAQFPTIAAFLDEDTA